MITPRRQPYLALLALVLPVFQLTSKPARCPRLSRHERLTLLRGYHQVQDALSLRPQQRSLPKRIGIAGLQAAVALGAGYGALRLAEQLGPKRKRREQLHACEKALETLGHALTDHLCSLQEEGLEATTGAKKSIDSKLTITSPLLAPAQRLSTTVKLADEHHRLSGVSKGGMTIFTATAIATFIALRLLSSRSEPPSCRSVLKQFAANWPTLRADAPPSLHEEGNRLHETLIASPTSQPWTEEEALATMQRLDLIMLEEITKLMGA